MEDRQLEEIKRHFDVVAESLRNEIKLVAEGVVNLDGKFEREITEFRKENRAMPLRQFSTLPKRPVTTLW